MDIKEVNNSLIQMLLGKNGTSAQNTSSQTQSAFAGLIAGSMSSPDTLLRPAEPMSAQVADTRPSAAEEVPFERPRQETPREEHPVREEDKAPVREEKPVRNERRKEKAAPDAAAAEAPHAAEAPCSSEAPREAASETAASLSAEKTGVSTVVKPLADAAPKTVAAPTVPTATTTAPVAALLNAEGLILLPQNVDLQTLAAQPQVSVLNQETGELVTMSGAELVTKIQDSASVGQLFVATAQPEDGVIQVLPAEAEKGLNGSVSNHGENVSAEEVLTPMMDEQTAEQAQILSEKIGKERNVKIDVSVKEEKISRADGSDANLVQNKIIIDEAVEAAGKEKDAPAAKVLPNAAASTSGVSGNTPQGIAAFAAPMADIETLVSANTAGKSGVESISALSQAHSTAGGAAASQILKPEISARSEDTSLRDVYKGMSREVVEQVKVNITKSAVKGVDKIDIQLKPEDLGHVQIKLHIAKDGKLQAEIIASRQETLNILQRDVDSLQKAFNDAGFDTDGSSFNFSFRGEEEQNHNSELRNFIGNVLEQESGEELAGNDNLEWSPAEGLNIRV